MEKGVKASVIIRGIGEPLGGVKWLWTGYLEVCVRYSWTFMGMTEVGSIRTQ